MFDDFNLKDIERHTREVMDSLIDKAEIKPGQLLIVGGSSSEVRGGDIGQLSSEQIGQTIISVIKEYIDRYQLNLAVQCCEHLNRALVLDYDYACQRGFPLVNARPISHAGGSFATAYWDSLVKPALVENIQANIGLDIGDSLIGMHLKPVVVPIRLIRKSIGQAHVTAAKTRLKLIGGIRAQYQFEK